MDPERPTTVLRRPVAAALGVLVLAWLCVTLQQAGVLGGTDGALTGDPLYYAVEVGAFLACAARAIVPRYRRWPWALVALGIAAFVAGDLCWTYAYGSDPPVPSLAD